MSSHRLHVIASVLFVALIACSRFSFGAPSFLIGLAVAGAAYLLAIRELSRTARLPRQVLFTCLLLSALWRIPFLLSPPGSDDDVHRYLWDGRVQRLGYNPYTAIPANPALASLHTAETRSLNNPEVPSPYPAGAQFFFFAVASIHESVFAFKIAFLICDFAIVFLLMHLLHRTGQGEHWVLAYAWHPLVATNVVNSGHIDILGALLLLVSFAALGRRWRMISAVAFGLAVSVKFLPIVLAPLYWRRIRIRDASVAALAVALLYVPFLERWRIPTGSLSVYIQRFRFNDPIFSSIERIATPAIAAGVAVLVGLFTAAWLRSREAAPQSTAWAWPMAASLVCAPVAYPWYLLWLLPFLGSVSTLPLTVWTVSILPTYFVWHLRSIGRPWQVPGWILLLEYGSVALTAAIVWRRRIAQPAMQPRPEAILPVNFAQDAELK